MKLKTNYEEYYNVEDQKNLRNYDLDDAVMSMIGKAHKILDAGCGAGVLAERLRKLDRDVTCLDIKTEFVRNARRMGFTAIKHDLTKRLPFKDKEFDLAICQEVLEHLPNPGTALKELFRVAKNVIYTLPKMHPDEWHLWMVDYKDHARCITIKMEEREDD